LLIEVGVHSRIIYEQEFEVALLQETADYYRTESNKFITVSACPQYLEKANQRLSQEYDRIQNYLSQSTEQALIQAFLDEYISDQHASNLLAMDQSGLISMIKNNKMQDLQLLYSLFIRRPKAFELLRKKLSDFIVEEGTKLVMDEQLKSEEFVV